MTDLRLRIREDHDVALIVEWCNDPRATRWMATGRVPMTADVCMQMWFPPNGMTYIIELDPRSSPVPIGVCGLFDVDLFSRKAELRILLGARRGEGYGTRAVEALLAIGFGRVNLHRIWLGTAEGNTAARQCFKACGFQEEGLLIDDLYRDGWHSDVRMAILEATWRQRKPLDGSANGHSTATPAVVTSPSYSSPAAISPATEAIPAIPWAPGPEAGRIA